MDNNKHRSEIGYTCDTKMKLKRVSDEKPPSYKEAVSDGPTMAELFNGLQLTLRENLVPSRDEVVCHLKLLKALYALRTRVESVEGPYESGLDGNDAKERRWAIFVSRAVERFERWWDIVIRRSEEVHSPIVKNSGRRLSLPSKEEPSLHSIPYFIMPPLDVLMVWHAYMLNPRSYAEDCYRFQLDHDIWNTQFPWECLNDMIDTEFKYNPPAEAVRLFVGKTGLKWENMEDENLTKRVSCFCCRYEFNVLFDSPSRTTHYSSIDLHVNCAQCNAVVTHESLRMNKLRQDLKLYKEKGLCLPGTLLHYPSGKFMFATFRTPFYTALDDPWVKTEFGKIFSNEDNTIQFTIKDVKAVFDRYFQFKMLADKKNVAISVRRFLANYWDNSSPFSVELEGAVLRQGVFIEKMNNNDWIHSPYILSAAERMIGKYQNFFKLMGANKRLMAVPTLDVDLVWHTHQLSPARYYKHSVAVTNQLIDHDDKVKETVLSDSFARTTQIYERTFKEVYSECMCWYCQAIREINSTWFSMGTRWAHNTFTEQAIKGEYDPTQDGEKHISAHSAIPSDRREREAHYNQLRDEYEKAFKRVSRRASKYNRPIPENFSYEKNPTFFPYYAMALTPAFYPVAPLCSTGTYGACSPGLESVSSCGACSGVGGGGNYSNCSIGGALTGIHGGIGGFPDNGCGSGAGGCGGGGAGNC
jgi:hypothetical protein